MNKYIKTALIALAVAAVIVLIYVIYMRSQVMYLPQ